MNDKKKDLIQAALLDLWKYKEDEERAKEAVKDWSVEELLKFIEETISLTSNEFTIECDNGAVWHVTYICHEERSKFLKVALFRQLQQNFVQDRVPEFYLKGINKKYLDFLSPNYGEDNEPERDEEEDAVEETVYIAE